MKYGCEYLLLGCRDIRTFEVEAKNEDEARLKMMKIAEKEGLYVQNAGRLVIK